MMELNQTNNNTGDVNNPFSSAGLTKEEHAVLQLTAQLYNDFIELEPQNQIDLREFAFHIHALQNIIASRIASRLDPNIWNICDYGEGRKDYKVKK